MKDQTQNLTAEQQAFLNEYGFVPYDSEQAFKDEIEPLLHKIRKIADDTGISIFFMAEYGRGRDENPNTGEMAQFSKGTRMVNVPNGGRDLSINMKSHIAMSQHDDPADFVIGAMSAILAERS